MFCKELTKLLRNEGAVGLHHVAGVAMELTLGLFLQLLFLMFLYLMNKALEKIQSSQQGFTSLEQVGDGASTGKIHSGGNQCFQYLLAHNATICQLAVAGCFKVKAIATLEIASCRGWLYQHGNISRLWCGFVHGVSPRSLIEFPRWIFGGNIKETSWLSWWPWCIMVMTPWASFTPIS